MKEVLPEPIYAAISTHLIDRATKAPEGWEGGSDDEDSLTGDLGGMLRTEWSPLLQDNGDSWRWRVRYKKFRGRGPRAFEKQSGADGIFQIEVSRGLEKHFKGLLFQAKKVGNLDGELVSQVEHMEQLAEGGSAIVEFGPGTYRAVSSVDYLKGRSTPSDQQTVDFQTLPNFLANVFLPCTSGLRGMYFDAIRALLILPNGVAHQISVRHRISIEAERVL